MTKLLNHPLIAVLLLFVLIAVSFLVLAVVDGATMDRVEWRQETYRVQSGDSLWTISREYAPENVDRNEWIAEVQRLNGLTSEFIYPGQRLTVLAVDEEV